MAGGVARAVLRAASRFVSTFSCCEWVPSRGVGRTIGFCRLSTCCTLARDDRHERRWSVLPRGNVETTLDAAGLTARATRCAPGRYGQELQLLRACSSSSDPSGARNSTATGLRRRRAWSSSDTGHSPHHSRDAVQHAFLQLSPSTNAWPFLPRCRRSPARCVRWPQSGWPRRCRHLRSLCNDG